MEKELKLSPKYALEVPSSSSNLVLLFDQNVVILGHGPLGDKGNT